jgi:hypothetical protein
MFSALDVTIVEATVETPSVSTGSNQPNFMNSTIFGDLRLSLQSNNYTFVMEALWPFSEMSGFPPPRFGGRFLCYLMHFLCGSNLKRFILLISVVLSLLSLLSHSIDRFSSCS